MDRSAIALERPSSVARRQRPAGRRRSIVPFVAASCASAGGAVRRSVDADYVAYHTHRYQDKIAAESAGGAAAEAAARVGRCTRASLGAARAAGRRRIPVRAMRRFAGSSSTRRSPKAFGVARASRPSGSAEAAIGRGRAETNRSRLASGCRRATRRRRCSSGEFFVESIWTRRARRPKRQFLCIWFTFVP